MMRNPWRPAAALAEEMRLRRDIEPVPAEIAEPLLAALVCPLPAELERVHRVRIEAAISEAARTAAPRPTPSVAALHSGPGGRISRAAARSRIAVAAGAAVLAVPLSLAGLATAGVKLPAPATSTFERIGITLPNQAAPADASDEVPGRGEPVSGEKPGSAAEKKSGVADSGKQGRDARNSGGHGRDRANGDSRKPAAGGPRSDRAPAGNGPGGPQPRPTDTGQNPPAHGVQGSPPRNPAATDRPEAPPQRAGEASGAQRKAAPPAQASEPTVEE